MTTTTFFHRSPLTPLLGIFFLFACSCLHAQELSEALDTTNFTWTTTGSAPWFAQSLKTHDGVDAARSGTITHNQQSQLQTTVSGPARLSFWWKIEAEPKDFINFALNGIEQGRLSGTSFWQQKTFYIGAGDHSVGWTYTKDQNGGASSDAAWVDEVLFLSGGTEPIIVTNASSQTAGVGADAMFRATVDGTPPLYYQWQFENVDISNATNAVLTLTNVAFADAGNYRLVISNDFGVTTSTNAILSVLSLSAWGAGKTNGVISPNYGQSQIPAYATNLIAIAAGGFHNLALRSDGIPIAWGYNGSAQLGFSSSVTNIIAIAAGNNHSLALKSSGIPVGWGANNYSQTTIPSSATNVTAIASGWEHNVALRGNGTVVAWGAGVTSGSSPHFGQSVVPTSASNVVAVAAGGYHSLALKRDGTVVAWGANASGQSSVPLDLTNVIAIAAGGSNSVALKSDRTVVVWGDNTYGQGSIPDGLTNVVAIAAGGNHVLALTGADTVVAWGANSSGQTNVPGALTNVCAIAAGRAHCIALLGQNSISLLSQPVDQNVAIGRTATFKSTCVGPSPLFYQWQQNGTNIPGATSSLLIVTNVQFAHEGAYRLVVSNLVHTVISSNANLVAIDLPRALDATNFVWTTTGSTNVRWFPQTTISHDGIAAASSGPATFSQGATLSTTIVGEGTVTFWWMAVDSFFSSFANLTFSRNNSTIASYTRSGWKQKTVYLPAETNVLRWTIGSMSSTTVTGYVDQVTFIPGPTGALITSGPVDRTVSAGTNVTLNVTAEGTPPLSYQWQFEGVNIMGATNSSFNLVNVQSGNTGSYSVVVTNSYGGASAGAGLVVTPSVPSIWTQPSSQEMVRGGTITFTVVARGTDPLSYQWQFNGDDLVGATDSTLILSNVQTNDAGVYRVAVSNLFGGLLSSQVTLQIVPTVIVGWGSVFTSSPNPPLGLTNVSAISAGDNFSVAVKKDGTVYAWGWNAFSRLNVPTGLSNIVMISAGGYHTSGLLNDGTVTNWGDSFFDASVIIPAGLSNVVDIAAGYKFNLALNRDGNITAWGDNSSYPLIPPPGLQSVVHVEAGRNHSMALNSDGQVVCWGNNFAGQTNVPSGLSNVVALAAGNYHSVALKEDGTVAAWGSFTNVPAGLDGVVDVAAGDSHSLALRSDGTVIAWGVGDFGQTNVPFWLTNVVAVAGGAAHSLALLNDGSPYIVRQPWTQTLLSGTTAKFHATALGIQPLTYQWQFNGTNIDHATNSFLTVSNAPLNAAGIYQCTVSNSVGVATTQPAFLSILRSTPYFVPELSRVDLNGNFNLHLAGLSGHGQVVVFASTNLIDWEPVFTNTPVMGTLMIPDQGGTTWSRRFYRVQEE